jgi:hypothetical protein
MCSSAFAPKKSSSDSSVAAYSFIDDTLLLSLSLLLSFCSYS